MNSGSDWVQLFGVGAYLGSGALVLVCSVWFVRSKGIVELIRFAIAAGAALIILPVAIGIGQMTRPPLELISVKDSQTFSSAMAWMVFITALFSVIRFKIHDGEDEGDAARW